MAFKLPNMWQIFCEYITMLVNKYLKLTFYKIYCRNRAAAAMGLGESRVASKATGLAKPLEDEP